MTNIITSYMSAKLIPAETKTNSASTLGYARQTVSFDEHTKNNTNAARASLPIYQQCQRTKDNDEPCALLAPKPRGHPEFRSQVAAPDASL